MAKPAVERKPKILQKLKKENMKYIWKSKESRSKTTQLKKNQLFHVI